jgi:hypothetical protein
MGTTDHFDGRRFFNPTGPPTQPFSAVPRMLLERRETWPDRMNTPPTTPAPRDEATAVVTFIGHSTFLLQTAAGNVVTDPMYSDRAGPWNVAGLRRVSPPAVALEISRRSISSSSATTTTITAISQPSDASRDASS